MQYSEKIELNQALKLRNIAKKFQDPPEFTDINQHSQKNDVKWALKLKHIAKKFQDPPEYIVYNSKIEATKGFKSNKTAFYYPWYQVLRFTTVLFWV